MVLRTSRFLTIPTTQLTRPRLLRQRLRHISRSVDQVAEIGRESSTNIVEDTIEFLKEDLKHLFDDKGIDASRYDNVVEFQDPVSSYSSLDGYLFNIRLLKNIFDPIFILHDIKQTGEYEITTRWTMEMKYAPAANSFLKRFWNPKLVFTGVSIYGINPANGKINRHIDLWDAINNQQFFSLEAFIHIFSQLLDLRRTPTLETPDYTVLKKTSSYEIRQYNKYIVAETKMQSAKGMTEYNPASLAGGSAFNELAGYIFGNNATKEKMDMTTPVFTDTTGNMQFVMGSKFQDVTELPEPGVKSVEPKEVKGGVFAVSIFNGAALENEVTNEHTKLEKAMIRDNLKPGVDWILARYNDPFTNPLFRRNEILIPIEDGFSLW